jgi:beta-lactamase superfamily II metal-dependent hydrolase
MFRRFTLLLLAGLAAAQAQPEMQVHFIDVGQASAALVEFPNGAILIDAGGEVTGDTTYRDHLLGYLEKFFQRRGDLQRHLDSIIITHPHIDHTRFLTPVMAKFEVSALIDGGGETGSGMAPLRKARETAREQGIEYLAVRNRGVTRKGRTNLTIDPFDGPDEPDILLLAGGRDCANENNDSLVIRVDFRQASFLFTGDAEIEDDENCAAEIPMLVDRFRTSKLLDVDVLVAAHHGSRNGTSQELMEAVSPKISILSAGRANRKKPGNFHAFQFGHPRQDAVDLLAAATALRRPTKTVPIFPAARRSENRRMESAVYCTCWDGDIVVSVQGDGSRLEVETSER